MCNYITIVLKLKSAWICRRRWVDSFQLTINIITLLVDIISAEIWTNTSVTLIISWRFASMYVILIENHMQLKNTYIFFLKLPAAGKTCSMQPNRKLDTAYTKAIHLHGTAILWSIATFGNRLVHAWSERCLFWTIWVVLSRFYTKNFNSYQVVLE